jgi:4-amino-4-deoxy-L-arabinose transferase-like glycosyltransferase
MVRPSGRADHAAEVAEPVGVNGALPPVAWRWAGSAMAALAIVLSVTSNAYGFERDELYFRMLPLAWGYVDQGPFTPLVARLAAHLSSAPWAERLPATACAVLSVLVLVLISRELGGGATAQGLCAWGYAFAPIPLVFGHVLLTASADLVVWPLACLFAIRAVRRAQPRWWLAAGVVVGLSTYNKLLIVLLVVAVVAGLLITGPRRALADRWFLLAVAVAIALAVPNLVYQVGHAWPELAEGRALRANNAATVRVVMWPYLIILLGPALVPVWVGGLVALARRPQWRALRFLPAAFAVLLAETFLAGGQLYYPMGLLIVLYAVGCVPTADFLARSRPWRLTAVALIAVNAAVAALIALPLVPVSVLGRTPIPAISKAVQDQIGWPQYAAEVAAVYRSIPAAGRARTVLIASNYGEAGALNRYGPGLGLPTPYSGHNALYALRRPPDSATTAVVIGGQLPDVRALFASCTIPGHLQDHSGVANEEQGKPIAICRGPRQPWHDLWTRFRHYG